MPALFDTHCHFSLLEAPASLPDTFQQNFSLSVLNVSTSPDDWLKVLQSHSNVIDVYPALGLHPWFIEGDGVQQLTQLEALLSSHQLAAIGEIGLDFYDDRQANQGIQRKVFQSQLKLAQQYEYAVSLHCRKAHNQMLLDLKSYPVCGVMHGFSGSVELARQFIQQGMKIGIGAQVLNPNSHRYHRLVTELGIEHLVLETDAPFGKTQTGHIGLADIEQIADAVSELCGCESADVMEQTTANAMALFGKNRMVKEDK